MSTGPARRKGAAVRLLAATVLLLAGTGCGAAKVLEDEASCPGPACTPDTRDRVAAIAALDPVTDVVRVSRSYGLDRGSSKSAEVRARVTTPAEARAVAEDVIDVLGAWPDHTQGTTWATVHADPAVEVSRYLVGSEDLHPNFYAPCDPDSCRSATADLEQDLAGVVTGADHLTVTVAGTVLKIRGEATGLHPSSAYHEVVIAAREHLDVQVAEHLRVRLDWTAPLVVTVRLDDGLCEAPPGGSWCGEHTPRLHP